jgi:hypothetical protein
VTFFVARDTPQQDKTRPHMALVLVTFVHFNAPIFALSFRVYRRAKAPVTHASKKSINVFSDSVMCQIYGLN